MASLTCVVMDPKGKGKMLGSGDIHNICGDHEIDVDGGETEEHNFGEEADFHDDSDFSYDDIMNLEFDSPEAAEEFYKCYARNLGFSIRKRSSKKNVKGQVRMCLFVCQKEGRREGKWQHLENRQRTSKLDFREDCPAMFQVNYHEEKMVYFVKKFSPDHSHDMVPPEHVHFLRSHRNIDKTIKAEIDALRTVAVPTSKIIDLMAGQSGGFDKIGCTVKDVYNHVDVSRRNQIPFGDAQGVVHYFNLKSNVDSGFYFKYERNPHGELGSMFWSDSTCRLDYSVFGDVIAFDSAYKRNVYDRPMVMVIGLNHHHQSCVFSCAILENETIPSYAWLLQQILTCMGGKPPVSICTDGDASMRAAISHVMPTSCHRICAWHLEQRVMRRVQSRDILKDFGRLIFDRMEVGQFQTMWDGMISKYQLQQNTWFQQIFAERTMWAEAWLKDHFMGGVRSTSRCEGMHHYMDSYVQRSLNLTEFLEHYEIGLDRIRNKERELDHVSLYGIVKCKHPLKEFEVPAAKAYTRKSLLKFQKELMAEPLCKSQFSQPQHEGDCHFYVVGIWNNPSRLRTVVYNTRVQSVKCSCKLLESNGFPCRHALHVLKLEGLPTLPDSCILKRWTKHAKVCISGLDNRSPFSEELRKKLRFGSLCTQVRSLCHKASAYQVTTNEVSQEFLRLAERVSELAMQQQQTDDCINGGGIDMRDPQRHRSKGGPRKSKKLDNPSPTSAKKCGICRVVGHTKRTCPYLAAPTQLSSSGDD